MMHFFSFFFSVILKCVMDIWHDGSQRQWNRSPLTDIGVSLHHADSIIRYIWLSRQNQDLNNLSRYKKNGDTTWKKHLVKILPFMKILSSNLTVVSSQVSHHTGAGRNHILVVALCSWKHILQYTWYVMYYGSLIITEVIVINTNRLIFHALSFMDFLFRKICVCGNNNQKGMGPLHGSINCGLRLWLNEQFGNVSETDYVCCSCRQYYYRQRRKMGRL